VSQLPEVVSQAWESRQGPIVFTTVDEQGTPNAIYATCVSKYDESTLVVADNFFGKTRANIKAGSQGSILFITDEGKAYQVKGTISYTTAGAVFDDMKCWNGERPGNAAAALSVEAVYSGSTQLA